MRGSVWIVFTQCVGYAGEESAEVYASFAGASAGVFDKMRGEMPDEVEALRAVGEAMAREDAYVAINAYNAWSWEQERMTLSFELFCADVKP